MNDETRKALDKIFNSQMCSAKPIGGSTISLSEQDRPEFRGKFEVYGYTLNHLRKLYDDAIAADDAAKLDAQLKADAKTAKDKQDKQDKQNKGDAG